MNRAERDAISTPEEGMIITSEIPGKHLVYMNGGWATMTDKDEAEFLEFLSNQSVPKELKE